VSRPSSDRLGEALAALRNGELRAADRLIPELYAELRRLAASYLRRERRDHTLQPTALVHEAYLRLLEQEGLRWQDRAHFLGWAARIMRQILVSHARAHRAQKRGGLQRVPLDEVLVTFEKRALDIEALDEALQALAALDEQKSSIVELRFFGGLSVEEVAEVLSISKSGVEREWRMARAWLRQRIEREGPR
jgi:RNA polymerase sigma factor (TIGR02999 family)